MMPIFFSVVMVLRNRASELDSILNKADQILKNLATDYEIIVIDNGSTDDSIVRLKALTGQAGLPNLQVFVLTNAIDNDLANWVGVENALGDFVAIVNPSVDDISILPQMLEKSVIGADLVFARNRNKPRQRWLYYLAYSAFALLYRWFNGIDYVKESVQFQILSKRVVNFISQHPEPVITLRHIKSLLVFERVTLDYEYDVENSEPRRLIDGLNLGIKLLISTTNAPMRIVTGLSLFGAFANLIYSIYVVMIAIFKSDVAAGWVSLSLQQSGMFFLISLVLWVLGEYILHTASLSNDSPRYHIGQEFTSSQLTRYQKLNIDEGLVAKNRDVALRVDK